MLTFFLLHPEFRIHIFLKIFTYEQDGEHQGTKSGPLFLPLQCELNMYESVIIYNQECVS